MNKLKPILLMALIFIAGFAAGAVVTRIAVRRFVQRAIVQPELLREKIERDLVRQLQLDTAQRGKVQKILMETHARIKALRREVQPQFAGVIRDSASEISAILTPEQRERFEKFRAENAPILQLR